MASRSKSDLHLILSNAYERAVVVYRSRFPDAPLPFITCTYRSKKEQDALFNKKPPVTKAKSGQSPHNYLPSFAFDIAFLSLSKTLDWNVANFKRFAEIIIQIEPLIEWGGNFKSITDNPHFQ